MLWKTTLGIFCTFRKSLLVSRTSNQSEFELRKVLLLNVSHMLCWNNSENFFDLLNYLNHVQ